MKKLPRVIKAHQLKPGDRFSFVPAEWHGPGVVTQSYGTRFVLPPMGYQPVCVCGTWTLKFDNNKVVNPPGVWYGNPDTKVRLLKRGRNGKQRSK